MEIKPARPLLHNIFLSPAEPRLRAGWRLLLHTIVLGLVSVIFLLVLLVFPTPTGGGSVDSSLPSLIIELASIVIATWFIRRFIDRRTFRSLGFKLTQSSLVDLIVGFFIPGVLMGIIFILELALGWTSFEGWAWQRESLSVVAAGIFSGLFAFILVGFSEEILSRGYHLQNLKDGLNTSWAILISSGIFAVLHAANPNSSWISTLGILFAGFFLAYGWVQTRQLWLPIGLHIGWNFFEGNIFGFPVSGLTTFRLIHHTTTGPELITGGAFGPEAGLIVLPAMALGVLMIYLYTTKIRSSIP
jgi:membrane protease YdiL (CAAX protease family)